MFVEHALVQTLRHDLERQRPGHDAQRTLASSEAAFHARLLAIHGPIQRQRLIQERIDELEMVDAALMYS